MQYKKYSPQKQQLRQLHYSKPVFEIKTEINIQGKQPSLKIGILYFYLETLLFSKCDDIIYLEPHYIVVSSVYFQPLF